MVRFVCFDVGGGRSNRKRIEVEETNVGTRVDGVGGG